MRLIVSTALMPNNGTWKTPKVASSVLLTTCVSRCLRSGLIQVRMAIIRRDRQRRCTNSRTREDYHCLDVAGHVFGPVQWPCWTLIESENNFQTWLRCCPESDTLSETWGTMLVYRLPLSSAVATNALNSLWEEYSAVWCAWHRSVSPATILPCYTLSFAMTTRTGTTAPAMPQALLPHYTGHCRQSTTHVARR